ncbi:hypothetical protein D3C76_1858440 [compost metagenome]
MVSGEPLTISSGSRKSFQIHITSIMTMVVVTDFSSGKMTLKNRRKPDAPSIVALSSISTGIPLTNPW